MTVTASANVTPKLFYDFNSPPDTAGLYWVPSDLWQLHVGQRVLFGCEEDEVMASGRVVGLVKELAMVEWMEWL